VRLCRSRVSRRGHVRLVAELSRAAKPNCLLNSSSAVQLGFMIVDSIRSSRVRKQRRGNSRNLPRIPRRVSRRRRRPTPLCRSPSLRTDQLGLTSRPFGRLRKRKLSSLYVAYDASSRGRSSNRAILEFSRPGRPTRTLLARGPRVCTGVHQTRKRDSPGAHEPCNRASFA